MQSENPTVPIEILLIEDSPTDVLLTREALKDAQVNNNLHTVSDGEKAMAFLRKEAPYGEVPRPNLVLLDLNMPKKNGRQVLAEVKADEVLKTIPIVVLTTSQADEDILKAYDLNANCYVTKPVDFEQFVHVVKSIENFWFSVVTLPKT